MKTAKQALYDAGRIKQIGRGRISLDNHQWLAEQAEKGVKFSDWPKGKIVSAPAKSGNSPEIRVVRDPAQSTEKIIADLYYRFDEYAWQAVAEDGTIYGMREVCNKCGISLVGHLCDTPSVLGYPVKIVPRG